MKKIIVFALGLLFILSYSCKQANEEVIKFSLEPKSNSNVTGEVTFTEKDGEVKMIAMLTGLTEGEHAIHIHEKADCSSADGKSSGGHWNPTFQPHAKWGAEEGYHKGDIGNFNADAEGNAKIEFATDEWCISCDDETKNIIGKGVIVHQGVDDFTSQPSGAAGKRVSCTGIIPIEQLPTFILDLANAKLILHWPFHF